MAQEFVFKTREEKKNYVERMFGQIARRYDFFNHFLSLGFDYSWRKRAIQVLRERGQYWKNAPHILDIACGTGDLSFEALRQTPDAQITGVDLAEPMLELFRAKAEAKGVAAQIERGDVENLQFAADSFDGVTIGFGTRNFTDLLRAFQEIHRVLKPGGVFVNLELARPRVFPVKQMYRFYFDFLLPRLARMFAGDRSAYRYLPDSLRRFPDLEALADIMKQAGFRDVKWETRTTGIVAIHSAIK
jgi:demethylmenaquinone methyltransferase/2-methoxy-6-polyprenyl-1,4-benzoquinol methylase